MSGLDQDSQSQSEYETKDVYHTFESDSSFFDYITDYNIGTNFADNFDSESIHQTIMLKLN